MDCHCFFDEGVPLTLITEAVYARCLSALKKNVFMLPKYLPKNLLHLQAIKRAKVENMKQAHMHVSKIISYAQGICINENSSPNLSLEFKLRWNCSHVARWLYYSFWLLGKIKAAYDKIPL